MMDGTIGELSGGWQMKLRLAKAVLIDADILLLDEPVSIFFFKFVSFLSFCDRTIYNTQNMIVLLKKKSLFIQSLFVLIIIYFRQITWIMVQLIGWLVTYQG